MPFALPAQPLAHGPTAAEFPRPCAAPTGPVSGLPPPGILLPQPGSTATSLDPGCRMKGFGGHKASASGGEEERGVRCDQDISLQGKIWFLWHTVPPPVPEWCLLPRADALPSTPGLRWGSWGLHGDQAGASWPWVLPRSWRFPLQLTPSCFSWHCWQDPALWELIFRSVPQAPRRARIPACPWDWGGTDPDHLSPACPQPAGYPPSGGSAGTCPHGLSFLCVI